MTKQSGKKLNNLIPRPVGNTITKILITEQRMQVPTGNQTSLEILK